MNVLEFVIPGMCWFGFYCYGLEYSTLNRDHTILGALKSYSLRKLCQPEMDKLNWRTGCLEDVIVN